MPEFKVINLGEDENDGTEDYFYFLAKKEGKYLVDPNADSAPFVFDNEDADRMDEDHDSQDSNRESHEGNDYPDEEQYYFSDGRSVDSYDSQPMKIQKRHDLCRKKESEDEERMSWEDEEEINLARKKNFSTQAWLDKVLRKNKNGVTANKHLMDQIEAQQDHGYSSDDYTEYQVQDKNEGYF